MSLENVSNPLFFKLSVLLESLNFVLVFSMQRLRFILVYFIL